MHVETLSDHLPKKSCLAAEMNDSFINIGVLTGNSFYQHGMSSRSRFTDKTE